MDVRKSLGFKAYRFKDDLDNARRLSRKRGSELTIGQNKKIFDSFADSVNKAILSGVSSDEIIEILMKSGLPARTAYAIAIGDYSTELEIKSSRFDR